MRIKPGRTANCLTGIIQNEIEARERRNKMVGQGFDTRRVPQVEPVQLQPVPPLVAVGFLQKPISPIPRETGRHNHMRPGSQQLQHRA